MGIVKRMQHEMEMKMEMERIKEQEFLYNEMTRLKDEDKHLDVDFFSLLFGVFMVIFTYNCLVHLNFLTTTLFGIMLCIFYLLYDLTVTEGIEEKMKRAIKRLEKKWFLDKSQLDAEKRASKRLVKECYMLHDRVESERQSNMRLREQEWDYRSKKEKEVRELKDKVEELEDEVSRYKLDILVLNYDRLENEYSLKDRVEELEEEVRTYKEDIERLKEDLDYERSENEELIGEVEGSRVVMKEKDLLVKHLQGELDVKEQELSVLKCEIAKLRVARGEEDRKEVLKLEKKLKEVEAEKEERVKTEVLVEDVAKIGSLRDSKIAKSLKGQENFLKVLKELKAQLEKANTRNIDDDEGYEVV